MSLRLQLEAHAALNRQQSCARLDGANLDGASLDGARLDRASLDGARLDGASLNEARLDRASLVGTTGLPAGNGGPPETLEQRAERLRRRAARRALRAAEFRSGHPDVPVIEQLDQRILEAIGREGCALNMTTWHTCQTTHCRAGWAITLTGDAGRELEARLGPHAAGALIYLASVGYVPDFYASTKAAMADMREAAAGTP